MPIEVIQALEPRPGESAIDCTAGLGGHASLIAERIGSSGRLLLLDLDPANLALAASRVASGADPPKVIPAHASFALVEAVARREAMHADLLLADLGVSSNQIADASRGLSFMADGPLDMRLDPGLTGTAADLVNALPESALADLIFELGEEPLARRIARGISEARRHRRIETTACLASIVRDAYGSRAHTSRNHPATRTFMALRIAVNDELGALRALLEAIERGARAAAAGAPSWLASCARIAIITFHSLEDRLVKRAFKRLGTEAGHAIEVSKRPIRPTAEECGDNPRARSAKLRILRLTGRC